MSRYHRKTIPMHVKVAIARYYECKPGKETIYCHYCMDEGWLTWVSQRRTDHVALSDGFHWDHKLPVSRGGDNSRENICIACASCNLSKGAKVNWLGPIARWKLENYPEEYAIEYMEGAH